MAGMRKTIEKALSILEREREITIAKLALKLGRSYTYTRYYIVKMLRELLEDCIDIDNDTIKYTCNEKVETLVGPDLF